MDQPECTPTAPASGMARWQSLLDDQELRLPPPGGIPGTRPPGADLDLSIGWDQFEKLVLAVADRVLAIRGIKFRRYGVQGQGQHGIDLAGRDPDGTYVVVQCKDYKTFTVGHLRAAVDKFATGDRPFGARHLIIATSAGTERTQLADELDRLQKSHQDLELDLWGAEQINDHLRFQADVVARFWTRETAEVFYTGAPLTGVPAPLPDRQELADRILLGPLTTSEVRPILRVAQDEYATAPEQSAQKYGDIATRMEEAGFRGHATVLRERQPEALQAAEARDQAAELAARLAAEALHASDRHEPRRLSKLLDELARKAEEAELQQAPQIRRHAQIIRAAVEAVLHPLGTSYDTLANVLYAKPDHPAAYRPVLFLLSAERRYALGHDLPADHRVLIDRAVHEAYEQRRDDHDDDTLVRLRLMRAEYDDAERRTLLRAARNQTVPRRHAALIKAREARRNCLEGRGEEAVDTWREAVADAIHAGLTNEAADWLYAIRMANVLFGPLTPEIEEEHRLAQALRATAGSSTRLLNRARDPREQAMSALVHKKLPEAVLSAQCWLTDSVVAGRWAHEAEATELLAELYADNEEASRATPYYEQAGKRKQLTALAANREQLLPVGPLNEGPWWTLETRAALVAAQADLIPDDEATTLLADLTALASRGLAGELTESRTRSLTTQAVKSACALASRGTREQATTLLTLLEPEVARRPGGHKPADDEHAKACVSIAAAHPELAAAALDRLFDLAGQGVLKAANLMLDDTVRHLLGTTSDQHAQPHRFTKPSPLTQEQRDSLRARAAELARKKHYLTDVVLAALDPEHPDVRSAAGQARDRILQRAEPDPRHTSIGTRLVEDSYLVSLLDDTAKQECLTKVLEVAADPRETALTRQDALIAARNLAIAAPSTVKHTTFRNSQPFVLGERDGSHLDGQVTGRAHPLSAFRLNAGSASLRGYGLHLAATTATTPEEEQWVRTQARNLLHNDDDTLVQAAAVALSAMQRDTARDIDLNLLATHRHASVRRASAVLAVRDLARHHELAMRLTRDSDRGVRRTLAEALVYATAQPPELLNVLLGTLQKDVRHSVRTAATASSRAL
ncbi:hypothetical protein [Streptomyces sp. NPDC085466]|uniref:hypothetical protein n=1 Tax=Streptomyces sp. NPDC085466 TaxID=3365725 RepID=UPI0037D4AC2C